MTDEYAQLEILGKRAEPSKRLETFLNERPNTMTITFSTKELLCNCPVTKQPDYYACVISYVPGAECIETKSLKLFLQTFRDETHFAEVLVHKIRDSIIEACPSATGIVVGLTQQLRGGIQTEVIASSDNDDFSSGEPDLFRALNKLSEVQFSDNPAAAIDQILG